MIFPIVLYGDPILKKKAKEVTHGDESVVEFVENMFETMNAAQGVGLASPQVGQSLRLFIVDSTPMEENEEDGVRQVFINPVMLNEEGEPWIFEEGCLSIPDVRGDVNRPAQLRLRYMDENFVEKEEVFTGINARVIQHEYDHIDGILFTEHLKPIKRRLVKRKLDNIKKGIVSADYKMKFARLK